MQNFFVQIEHDNGTDFLKTTAIDRESLLKTLPETLGCPLGAIKRVVEVGSHEFEKFPASVIKTSAGLFKLVIYKVNTKYGAPMGRNNQEPDKLQNLPLFTPQKNFDRTVPLDGGGYDAGGAYWGTGAELRVTYNEDLTFVRFYRR